MPPEKGIMLILKSASPRRKQALESLGLTFSVRPSSVSEEFLQGERPLDYLKRVTLDKLESPAGTDTLISCDTIVVLENRLFPKPESPEQAMEFLQALSGKEHSVFTGLAIYSPKKTVYEFDETKVLFRNWTDDDRRNYVSSAKPFDKAGAYGIQDVGSPAESFEGSYWNVVGFPMRKFLLFLPIWKEFLR
ncbi:MAG TPA: nucleoside triphosphate pyrophosphatase [Leptospiraceae bacterium]|nr:nucleoside triphosphate pyrophosphatase [Leptospiraceae bacterium]